jgi:uncharacterized protein with von Willebrand factor type A (vWA) domain
VGFGSHFAPLFPDGSSKYDGESLQVAMNYASGLNADMGGTEIVQPLKAIYDMPKKDGYKRQVIVLTDGEVKKQIPAVGQARIQSSPERLLSIIFYSVNC